ncbi:GIY-YIG nuclease family protein [Cyanobacteria bacterium FACHB-63]|nr:GIY-YIG nuclease family protein [Cyanobacteria bacterium FACHB-63]
MQVNLQDLPFELSEESIQDLVATIRSDLHESLNDMVSTYYDLILGGCPDIENPARIKQSVLNDYDRLNPISEFSKAEVKPGVYFFTTRSDILYVGMSENVRQRLTHHNYRAALKEIPDARFGILLMPRSPRTFIAEMETRMIQWLKPTWNIKDNPRVESLADILNNLPMLLGDFIKVEDLMPE